MTEDEAKTKWCPFARVAAPIMRDGQYIASIVANRVVGSIAGMERVGDGEPSNPADARCIGSACMAWRWNDAASKEAFQRQAEDGMSRAPIGFCGLAGAPQ